MVRKISKKLLTFILLIVVVAVIITIILVINNGKKTVNEYDIKKDLTYIKQSINNNEYYLFEDNNQKYIIYKEEASIEPGSVNIKSVDIKRKEYNEKNQLVLDVDVDIDAHLIDYSELEYSVDGINKDSEYLIIKVKENCSGLIVNDKEYTKFQGNITYHEEYNKRKYGFIDENGNITIPIEYDNIRELENDYYDPIKKEQVDIDYNNYLIVVKGYKYGIISKDGQQILECKYNYIVNYDKNKFLVTKDGNTKIGIVDINGNLLKGYINAGVENLSHRQIHEYFVYKLDNKKGVMDRNLNIIINAEFDEIDFETLTIYNNFGDMKEEYFGGENGITYKEDYLIVEKNDKRAIIDYDGNIKMDYQDISIYNLNNEYRQKIMTFLKK